MRQGTVDEHVADFVWPAESAARRMHRGGLALLVIGAVVLALGLMPGVALPRVLGIDPAFIACAGVIGGLLLRSYGASRAFARRLRIDRRARSVERARQTAKGARQTDLTLGFDDCATVAIVEHDVDDRATSFDLVATREDGEKVRLWPVTLRTRQKAEAALAALREALSPASRSLAEGA
jgi:hypothetical protein